VIQAAFVAAIVAWLAAAAPSLPARAEARPLVAASDGVHAWMVVERTRAAGTEHVLLHHAEPMGCDCVHEAFVLSERPEALAAAEDRVWMVMPAGPAGRRDVYSLSVQRNPATGAYYSLPPGRLEIHPSLPAGGELLSASIRGGTLEVRRSGARPEALVASGWIEASDAGAESPDPPFSVSVPGAARRARLVRLDSGMRAIEYVTGSGVVRLAEFEAPSRAFAVLGVGDRFGIFVPTGEGGAAVRWVDPIDGTVASQQVLEPQPADATTWVCLAVLAVMAVGAVAGLAARRVLRLKSSVAERR
jgi:hypothetical protein